MPLRRCRHGQGRSNRIHYRSAVAVYQRLLIKLTTHRSKKYKTFFLDKLGPKRLLQGLMTRANEVAINETTLDGSGQFFGGSCLMLALNDAYNFYSNQSPRELIAYLGSQGASTWNTACTEAYESSHKTVVALCQEGSTSGVLDAATVDELALMVWASTFYHAVIGDFQLDNVIKGNLPLLNTGKPHVQTKSYGTLSTTIGVTTMTRTCNMETLST